MTDAQTFRNLHRGTELLILPNAWDAGSARLMAEIGAKAIATTSSGVAWSHGYRDGNQLPIDLYATTVRNIRRIVNIPISVDVEGGYHDDPARVYEVIARVIDAGAVGINIEDGSGSAELACAKIEAARRAGANAGIELFINARTDVYLRRLAPEREIETTLVRARVYAAAGCDGLFVPGVTQSDAIKQIVAGTSLPVNVMLRPQLPNVAALQHLGVRRLSAGGAIAEALWGRGRRLGAALLKGDIHEMFTDAMSYPDINKLFPA